MAGRISIVLAVVLLPSLAVAVVSVVGIRSQSRTVRDAARAFRHGVGNRVQMRRAGAPGARASVLMHRGRTTGRTYRTPVWAAPTEDGFVIGIVYGSRTDWLKNVLASGEATIVHDGRTCSLDRPEIVPMDGVRAYFPLVTQRLQRPVHVDRCLRLRLQLIQAAEARGEALPVEGRFEAARRRS